MDEDEISQIVCQGVTAILVTVVTRRGTRVITCEDPADLFAIGKEWASVREDEDLPSGW